MEARGVSVAGAGSCIIDAGGDEEVNQYLKLCQSLGKNAHFLYDLDSLFGGNLRACIKDDESVQGFLASAGLGNDFGKYCGQLEQELTQLIDKLDSLVKTRFEEVPAISHICALPYVGVVYGTETVYCTPARVRLFKFGLHRLFTRESNLSTRSCQRTFVRLVRFSMTSVKRANGGRNTGRKRELPL